MELIFYWTDHAGVAVFAIAGTLLAFRKKMDGFGVLILASATAIGGGTTRDLILGLPVFWTHDPNYLYTIIVAALLTITWLRFKAYIPMNTLMAADAVGLAFFATMGAEKTLSAGFPPFIAIIMGTISACFGGMLRDVLARDIPMVLKSELYATTCIIGATVYVILVPFQPLIALAAGMASTLLIRLGAIKFNWSLTVFPDHHDHH
ncbi:trimeric intracellular cation channel family protein [Idiomarina sp. HP20-50]|uniref:trimeric intracellular cation channel family protein n=1 Tax=Idiomarina sp. HP20-50 TaxID=3070813 RepID=UPI00294B2221|nr:trimeric intracellular cation channel family protein [Idiomarina sp. HP20-50]MDV6315657.1 trimeric intracellular cation channel family protein [Idiomarina sp. HP20-50]